MCSGSNGVDQVRSVRKILMQLRLGNLCVNGTSSASFTSTFCCNETARNIEKHKFWFQWSGSGAFVAKNSGATSFIEFGVIGTGSTSFALTLVH
jgi:hypothetical protein